MIPLNRMNLHTHTERCKHAVGNVDDYCRAASACGLRVLGFTDHSPLPDGLYRGIRMTMGELPDHLAEVEAAREAYPELIILQGMECEYKEEYASFFRDEFLGRLNFDYLIGGAHIFPWKGGWEGTHGHLDSHPGKLRAFAENLIQMMESGLFAFIAHPDVFGCSYIPWDDACVECSRDICRASVAYGVPLEINGYGLRKSKVMTPDGLRNQYPLEPFWELAATEGVEFVATSDAHEPENVDADIDGALAMGRRLGMKAADFSHLWGKYV